MACKIERRKYGVCGAGLSLNITYMEGLFGKGIYTRGRVSESG